MLERISLKTTPSTMSTTKTTKARVGSDEDMIRHGFHRSTPDEIAKYGHFLKRESLFSALYGMMRRTVKRRTHDTFVVREPLVFVAWQSGAAISQLGHQSQDQSDTHQNEATSTVLFQRQSEQWTKTSIAEPVLQH